MTRLFGYQGFRSIAAVVAGLAALVVLTFGTRAWAVGTSTPALPIGATYLELNDSHLNGNEIWAFVETGSLQNRCLATLAETNFAGVPALLFCHPRIAFGQSGVTVRVFFTAPPEPGLVLNLTLFQEGAKHYQQPVMCTADDGC